jgi:hypothetical protein
MPVTVRWYDDAHTIILYEFSGKWTWDEFYPIYEQAYEMITGIDGKVHSICMPMDDDARGHVPVGALTHIPSIIRKTPSNGGIAAVITQGRFWRTMDSMIGKMLPAYRNNVAFVKSLDEALERIGESQTPESVDSGG